jgi:hypothetical protein
MQIENAHMAVAAISIGGNGSNVRTLLTFQAQVSLSDAGIKPLADELFRGVPELFRLLEMSSENAGADLEVDAAQALDGLSAHILRLYSMPLEERATGTNPALEVSGVNLTGKVGAAVKHDDGNGVATAKVKIRVSAPSGLIKLAHGDLAGLLKTECWVDLCPLKEEIKPEIRKPAEASEDRQTTLLADSEWHEEIQWEGDGRDVELVIGSVPENYIRAANAMANIPGLDLGKAREVCREIRGGLSVTVATLSEGDANVLAQVLEECGCLVNRRAAPDPDAWMPQDIDATKWSKAEILDYVSGLTIDQAKAQHLHSTQKPTKSRSVAKVAQSLIALLTAPRPVQAVQ